MNTPDTPTSPQEKALDEALRRALSRRSALGLIGSAFGGMVLASCNVGTTDDTSSTTTSGSSSTDSSTVSNAACDLTPEGEIGPYFTDDSASGYNRSNILSNLDGSNTQSGIPLTLHLYVYDFDNSCAAVVGAQVDIWHCNAEGVYSNESVEGTTGETWLRGYQITDSNGLVTFKTIFPGWYSGRTTHIHLRVRSAYNAASSTSDGSNTTQLFFPQTTVDTIDTTVSPYKSEGVNPTTNVGDRVYAVQTRGKMELSLSGDASNGYVASCILGLPISA